MKIAIHAADLDHDRIDGTRVYIFNMLKNFGALNKLDTFYIYHKNNFNLHLTPPSFANYIFKKIPFPKFWTQMRFPLELLFDKPDVLWMPVHNVPIFRRKNLKVLVTIHDLAFKIFPEYFPKKDLFKLNRLTNNAIKNADRIIAISETTKKDIIKFYPNVNPDSIAVVYHGFDKQLFEKKSSNDESKLILDSYNLKAENYLLYVGAIQPRKDLVTLIGAFEKIRSSRRDFKLMLAGEIAWQAQATLEKVSASPYRSDIIITGTIPFNQLPSLYQNAAAFVFPSLYEGFGIPVLEAMASGVPTILAKNSSLLEAGGEAALYFETQNEKDLFEKIENVLSDDQLKNDLIRKGREHCENFSWEKCAANTLDNILKW